MNHLVPTKIVKLRTETGLSKPRAKVEQMLIDSHCHLASPQFLNHELEQIIARAKEAGVGKIITLATNLKDCPHNIAIASSHPEVYTCVGIHPCDVAHTPDDYLPALRQFASHDRCVAIGETGLDYFHPAPKNYCEEKFRQRQRDFLEQHFELAAQLNKNIVIHSRDRAAAASLGDCLNIYAKWNHLVRAVFHCFQGPSELAKKIYKLGGIISFTGISTFKKANACLEAAVEAPAGSFMLETDSPYLAPVPHRGKRCEPAFTSLIAEFIAHKRGETLQQLTHHTSDTAKKFYKI